MSATKVFGAGIALGIVGRWAAGKKALPDVSGSLQVAGALLLVAFLDRGKTEPAAKGLAWLFLAAVLLSDSSPLTGLAKAEGGRVPTPATGGAPAGALDPGFVAPTGGAASATATGGYTARATTTPRRTS